jgi:hypothetical protein
MAWEEIQDPEAEDQKGDYEGRKKAGLQQHAIVT